MHQLMVASSSLDHSEVQQNWNAIFILKVTSEYKITSVTYSDIYLWQKFLPISKLDLLMQTRDSSVEQAAGDKQYSAGG